jgi:phospholipid transport system substrate-binding protein
MTRRIFDILALLLALMFVTGLPESPAYAGKDGPGTKAVKKANDTITKLLKKKVAAGSEEEKKLAAKVTTSVRDLLDVDELGKQAMVDNWASLTAAQQTEFLTELRGLIEDNYIKGLRANVSYKIEYKGETKQTDGTLLVKTEIKAKRGKKAITIKVDYVLKESGGKYKVFDVKTDGVGLVESYRGMFNGIMKKGGFAELIKKMKAKRAEVAAATQTAAK